MACFVVPLGEAIVTTVVQKVVEKKEREVGASKPEGLTWSRKLSWLNRLLWGGVMLLALEHWWHGEVVPWPPFLTAMSNPADIGPMLHEMATIGTGMAVTVTVVWAVMVLVAERKVATALRLGSEA
ncbi:MAG: hypothetical protein ACPLPT_09105 [Moorellales bacterium]